MYFSKNREEDLPHKIKDWVGDVIFSFRNLTILTQETIQSATAGAINFHPGPPEYPGSGCLNFALYDGATTYGVTAHFMTDTIDAGPIIEVDRFPILRDDNVVALTTRTHQHLFNLARRVTSRILANPDQSFNSLARADSSIVWSGVRRKIREIDRLSTVEIGMDNLELERRVRAFHHPRFPLRMEFNGYEFFLQN